LAAPFCKSFGRKKWLNMIEGRLRVRTKEDGTISRFIILPGQRKIGIPQTFVITPDMDNQPCAYEVSDKGAIVKIIVGDKEVAIDNDMLKHREQRQQQLREAEAQRKKEEQEEKRKHEQQNNPNRQRGSALPLIKAYDPANFSRLPKDVRELLSPPQIDNLSLYVFKAANFWSENRGKATLFQAKRGSVKQGTPDQIMRHLPEGNLDYGNFPFAQQAQRQVANAQALYPKNMAHHHYRTQSRLVTGMGEATVFEVGFKLHHIYGFPYIPASSIKGVTRSWYILEKFDGNEETALLDRTFCDLFGCPGEWIEPKTKVKHPSWYNKNKQFPGDKGERKGNVIFFDAYPLQAPQVEDEVMNVHYPDYYQGKSLPTDYQMPVPIAFMAVAAKTTFQFVIATDSQDEKSQELLQTAEKCLHDALTEHGIGAKTAVGYGFMEKIQA
jgi:CRISPR-associated protein Cmr6